jgi:Cu+-exporting ATPase
MPLVAELPGRKINRNQAPACHHCHEACPDDSLKLDENYFCCQGCLTVYEILAANNLCTFYNLDNQAGKNQRSQKDTVAFAYLDDADIREKLLDFEDENTAQVTLYLPSMHCISCLWLLEHLYRLDSGINHTRVDFLKKTIRIQYDCQKTSLRSIACLLTSIGYPPDINLADAYIPKNRAPSRKLIYQITLAGFALGNIMLFSFPEYLGMSRDSDPWFASVLGYLSLVIATPVLLYSAADYLRSAWTGLRNNQLNVDLPLSLAILSLYGRSAWEIITQTGGGYLDSFAGLLFLLLNGKWFQQKTWNQLSFERDYKSYFPISAARKENAIEQYVPVYKLVPGDIIIVRSHEIIPADGILLKGNAYIDYSFVTGESVPVTVMPGSRIYAGGKQLGERIEISLTKRVTQSQLTNLWNNPAYESAEKGAVQQLADQAARVFSLIILITGFAGFLYWAPISMHTAINAFTAVLIVACPCTIIFSISFTLGNILRIFGRNECYLKNIAVIEHIAATDTVVFDKTGTITQNINQEAQYIGKALNPTDIAVLKNLTKHSAHPLSKIIHASLPETNPLNMEDYLETPGLGIQGSLMGKQVKLGAASFVGIPNQQGVFLSIDNNVLGKFLIKQRFRPGLFEIIQTLKQNKRVLLLSGDHKRTDAELLACFPVDSDMKFNQSPEDKLNNIKALQDAGKNVLMVGDGLNDAGALLQSNVGIVITENSNNFTPACDGILQGNQFHQLTKFIRLANSGVKIVKYSYIIALAYNAIGLGFAVTGNLSPLVAAILMPASSVSVVLFGIIAGNIRAKQLGLDK